MAESPQITACLTAFNRCAKTCAALQAFFNQEGDFHLSAVLMDDGSRDGTADAVRDRFADTIVLRGDGSLFWNGGMSAAYDRARERGADFFLWLNDDTMLQKDALVRLIRDYESLNPPTGGIVVGSTLDEESKTHTYGGVRSLSNWHPGRFALVEPAGSVQVCDAMNGNIVLISSGAAERLGAIDCRYTHSMGDYDYGLRARARGVPLVLGAGYHGFCPRNPAGSAWHEQATITERYRAAVSPKGLPMGEWAHFLRMHGGMFWPVAWLATYRRIVTG